ncbi:unnamed protein product [Caretta caretta]
MLSQGIGVMGRDLAAKIMGGVGAGLGLVNSLGTGSLALQVSNLGQEVKTINQPLSAALDKIGDLGYDLADVIKAWYSAQDKDVRRIISSIDGLQGNLSWALAYIQIQVWLQAVSSGILRSGLQDFLSIEIRNIMLKDVSSFEREHDT